MRVNVGICDVETGICEVPGAPEAGATHQASPQRSAGKALARLTYVTDPICSACWVSEPAWRSVTARYGDVIEVEHVFGGLLPGWEGFLDAGAGIRQPSDVSHHWDEFSQMTGQPIDASVWLTDPLPSSFPPSIAAVAVRMVAPALEERFLRALREVLFLEARNIARPEVLSEVAQCIGVDMSAYAAVLADGSAEQQFLEDRRRTRQLGVRGFPTVFVEGPAGRLVLHGIFVAEQLERALLAVTGLERRPHLSTVTDAITHLGLASTMEYSAALGWDTVATEQALTDAGMVRQAIGGGVVWSR